MNFKRLESPEKLRGGFYTPLPIAESLILWALRDKAHKERGCRILEPGCGDGAFLTAIKTNLEKGKIDSNLIIDGVEILPEEAKKSGMVGERLEEEGVHVQIHEGDFLEWILSIQDNHNWDVIVGNPPYIRYQYFEKEQSDFAAQIFSKAGVPFTKRTNAWVPFVIASVMHLAPGGRLAMVLPAELLHILHADGLRQLLEQEMESLDIIDIRELPFENVLQGVVLLRAVKKKGRKFIPLSNIHKPGIKQLNFQDIQEEVAEKPGHFQIQRLDALEDLSLVGEFNHDSHSPSQKKWTHWLLEKDEFYLLQVIETSSWALPFAKIANVDIGIVTGANRYFVVNLQTARQYDLLDIASPMLARSEFIEGITYTKKDQEQNEAKEKAVLFLRFPNQPKNSLPTKMAEYIELGEKQELDKRYKCRIREPWFVVPYIWLSDIALLKRCHDFPRLVLNEAHALSTDTAYRIRMNEEFLGREKDLVLSFLNSLTFLSAELEGRHYGGGVLELVPSEIEKLLIPLTSVTNEQFSCVDNLIRKGATVKEILDFTDPLILGPGTPANLSGFEIDLLRSARNRLKKRRIRSQ